MSGRRPGTLWFIHVRRALGWSFTGESRKPEASCLFQCFVLLAAARIASTQFLSCCLRSPRFTREALGHHRQNQWCSILPSDCRCRCRFIEYLASLSFTSLSLSAGGSTSLASNHSGEDLHEAVWGQNRLWSLFHPGVKHLDFKWSGIFVTRHRVKTEIVCRRECQLGLRFARRLCHNDELCSALLALLPIFSSMRLEWGKPVLCSDVGPWWDVMERSPAGFSSYGSSSQMASIYWPILCALCEVCMQFKWSLFSASFAFSLPPSPTCTYIPNWPFSCFPFSLAIRGNYAGTV